jgi:hypothetical protein
MPRAACRLSAYEQTTNREHKPHSKKNECVSFSSEFFFIKKKIFCRFATLRHGDTSVPDGLSR